MLSIHCRKTLYESSRSLEKDIYVTSTINLNNYSLRYAKFTVTTNLPEMAMEIGGIASFRLDFDKSEICEDGYFLFITDYGEYFISQLIFKNNKILIEDYLFAFDKIDILGILVLYKDRNKSVEYSYSRARALPMII